MFQEYREDVDIEVLVRRATRLADDHRQFMRQLIDARRSAKLSQAQVAERMGVSQPAVSKFERYDANPTLDTIRRYALAVGVGLRSSVLYDSSDMWQELTTSVEHLDVPERRPIQEAWTRPSHTRKERVFA